MIVAYEGLDMRYQRHNSSVGYEEMLSAFQKVVDVAPQHVLGYANLGMALYVGGKIQEVRYMLLQAIRLGKEQGIHTLHAEFCLERMEHAFPRNAVKFPNTSIVILWGEEMRYDN